MRQMAKYGPSVADGLEHEAFQELPVVNADRPRRLAHEDDGQVLSRVDPEVGAEGPAPTVVPGRAVDVRDAGLPAHREAQTKPVTRTRKVVGAECDGWPEMIRGHVLD